MADPMHQFEIHKVVDLPSFTLPGVGAIDMSITNSTVAMLAAATLVFTGLFPRILEDGVGQAEGIRQAALDAIAALDDTEAGLARDVLAGIKQVLDPANSLNPEKA